MNEQKTIMQTSFLYPFDDGRYIQIILKDDSDIIVGSIEGVPSFVSIQMNESNRRLGYATLLVNEFKKQFAHRIQNTSLLSESEEIADHLMTT